MGVWNAVDGRVYSEKFWAMQRNVLRPKAKAAKAAPAPKVLAAPQAKAAPPAPKSKAAPKAKVRKLWKQVQYWKNKSHMLAAKVLELEREKTENLLTYASKRRKVSSTRNNLTIRGGFKMA